MGDRPVEDVAAEGVGGAALGSAESLSRKGTENSKSMFGDAMAKAAAAAKVVVGVSGGGGGSGGGGSGGGGGGGSGEFNDSNDPVSEYSYRG